jgi:hypothetical protein
MPSDASDKVRCDFCAEDFADLLKKPIHVLRQNWNKVLGQKFTKEVVLEFRFCLHDSKPYTWWEEQFYKLVCVCV